MTDEQLEIKLHQLVRTERRITREILGLIQEAEKRRFYVKKGYPSSYDWLIKVFGYSQTAAHRRIQSARLYRDFPEVGEKMETGGFNLSTACLIQSSFAREEKRSGKAVSHDTRKSLLEKAENKTLEEIQKLVANAFPGLNSRVEIFRGIGGEESRLSIVLEEKTATNLKRIKELLSHSLPGSSWSEVIGVIAEEYLHRKDPLRKMTHPVSDSETGCVIPENTRRIVLQRAMGQCEFIDTQSGRRCSSRHQIELDHIHPKALGGTNEPANLRALCKPHNLYEAERVFGKEKISPYRASTAR